MLRRHLLSGVLFTTMALGCATTNTLSRPILEDGYNTVRLEAWLDASRQAFPLGFEHPAAIRAEELTRLLQSIQVVEPPGLLSTLILKAKPTAEPAFTAKEAEFLAKPLAAALGTARPDERVVFFLHHQKSLYKGTTSSGVVFVKDKRLHLILGRYQMGNQPGRPDIPTGGNPFPESNDQNFYIAPGVFQTLVEESKAPGGREAVAQQRWVSIDYASLLNPPAQTAEPTPVAPPLTLEEKLKTLNKLKEDGLITEEEYKEKRKELLKAF